MKIIIDDGGLDPRLDECFSKLLSNGLVNAVSIMVINRKNHYHKPYKKLAAARKHVHFCITFGQPEAVENWKSIGLVNKDGCFALTPSKLLMIQMLPPSMKFKKKFLEALRNEIELQYKQYQDLYGVPSAVDFHQHVQILPMIWNMMASVLEGENIQFRFPVENRDVFKINTLRSPNIISWLKSFALFLMSLIFSKLYHKKFRSFRVAGISKTADTVDVDYLRRLSDCNAKFVCHPGLSTIPSLLDSRLQTFLSSSKRKDELLNLGYRE